MTPFGQFLESLRRSRHLQQKQLAAMLNVNSCYVSAMERGKKGPPSKSILDKLINVFELDDEEQLLLWDSVDQSQATIRLPKDATVEEYALMRDLRLHLGSLSTEQIDIIRKILKMGANLKFSRKAVVRGGLGM